MIGLLTIAPGSFTHVLVAIDKLPSGSSTSQLQRSRQIEWLLSSVTSYTILTSPTPLSDLGSNFHSHQFWDFCECSSIEIKYVSVAHPRANAQVERANGLILDGLKK
jgi:hypothetical protein